MTQLLENLIDLCCLVKRNSFDLFGNKDILIRHNFKGLKDTLELFNSIILQILM